MESEQEDGLGSVLSRVPKAFIYIRRSEFQIDETQTRLMTVLIVLGGGTNSGRVRSRSLADVRLAVELERRKGEVPRDLQIEWQHDYMAERRRLAYRIERERERE